MPKGSFSRNRLVKNLQRVQRENFLAKDIETNPKHRKMFADIAMLAKCLLGVERMIGGPGDDVDLETD